MIFLSFLFSFFCFPFCFWWGEEGGRKGGRDEGRRSLKGPLRLLFGFDSWVLTLEDR